VTSADYFAGAVSERYDVQQAEMFAPEVIDPTVDFLAELAAGGQALELGIGTGRIALPLAARGVRVAGIDLSPDMVARLRAKAGGDQIRVEIGDFSTAHVDGAFTLAYVVFNTINNLTTQEAQLACFANVASQLEPGGCFVVEVGVPRHEPLHVFDLSETHVGIDEYDAATQRLVSHHFTLVHGSWERLSIPFRSVEPSELDLMARLAGLHLSERWAGWRREPFTSASTKHVSVWKKRSERSKQTAVDSKGL
jgi:SAM-dependent methyltransferase